LTVCRQEQYLAALGACDAFTTLIATESGADTLYLSVGGR
jgi:2-methylisocitrate lyase-like PEP mutase family enzyme